MNRNSLGAIFTATFLFVSVTSPLDAQTQGEMNTRAWAEFEKADAELNRIYKQLLPKLDSLTQADFKQAQRAWLVFRDAEAAAETNVESRGGTMASGLRAVNMMDLTQARTRQLKTILKGLADH